MILLDFAAAAQQAESAIASKNKLAKLIHNQQIDEAVDYILAESNPGCGCIFYNYLFNNGANPRLWRAYLENPILSNYLLSKNLITILSRTEQALQYHAKNDDEYKAWESVFLCIAQNASWCCALNHATLISYMACSAQLTSYIVTTPSFLQQLAPFHIKMIAIRYPHLINVLCLTIQSTKPVSSYPEYISSTAQNKIAVEREKTHTLWVEETLKQIDAVIAYFSLDSSETDAFSEQLNLEQNGSVDDKPEAPLPSVNIMNAPDNIVDDYLPEDIDIMDLTFLYQQFTVKDAKSTNKTVELTENSQNDTQMKYKK